MIWSARNARITCDFCGREVAEIIKRPFRRNRIEVCLDYIAIPEHSDCKYYKRDIHVCRLCREHLSAQIKLENARKREQGGKDEKK